MSTFVQQAVPMNAIDSTTRSGAVAAKILPPVSHQIPGAFYPLGKPSTGGELTQVTGRSGRAEGQVLLTERADGMAEDARQVTFDIVLMKG